MSKHKLVKIGKNYLTIAEQEIKDFIKDNYLKGEYVECSTIQKKFQNDLKIAEGTINNILKKLVVSGDISTFYEKGRRYYGPRKLPVSLKTGIAMATVVTFFWVVVDVLSPTIIDSYVRLGSDIHSNNIVVETSTLPFLLSSLVIIFIFTFFWFFIDEKNRKIYK